MPRMLRELSVFPMLLLTAAIGLASGATPTTITIAASANPVVYGQPVSVTATVSPAGATGKVTFYDGTTVLGVSPVAGGQAVLTTSLLASGARALKARYDGDATYAGSASAVVAETVTAIPGNGFVAGGSFGYFGGAGASAIADFNGDGKADVAVASVYGIVVYIGNGDGTFQNPTIYEEPFGPAGIGVGDFNGDGKSDIVVGGSFGSVSVLLGNGDGTFQTPAIFSIAGPATNLVIGDFNSDGRADVAVTIEGVFSNGCAVLNVLIGNGDGTLQPAVSYPVNTCPESAFAADFNGDGIADIAVTGNGGVDLLVGKGDGTFQPTVTAYSIGVGHGATADFKGDGKTDLVVVNSASVTTLLGNGDGTFRTGFQSGAGNAPSFVTVGDFNGDGKADLLVTNDLTSGPGVTVLLGNGDGTFQPGMNYLYAAYYAVTADFNGDGTTDVAALGNNTLNLLMGRASLNASDRANTTITLSSSVNPALNGQSVSLTAAVAPSSATGTVTVYDGVTVLGSKPLAGGQAVLTTVNLGPVGHSLRAFYGGDAGNAPSNSATLSQTVTAAAGGGFGVGTRVNELGQPPQEPEIVLGDFNGDGKLDLAATTQPGAVSVFLGNGDGTFQTGRLYGYLNQPVAIATGDFNLDGKLDLVVANGGNYFPLAASASVLLGNGDGTFQSPVSFGQLAYPLSVAVGDFNSDGKPDLLISTSNGTTDPNYKNNVSVLMGNGDGTFSSMEYLNASSPYGVAIGDFNGDGNADIVTADFTANEVSIFLGDGKGNFQPASNFAVTNSPIFVAVGDFNGDGKTDLVTASNDLIGEGVSVLLGNGDGTFQAAVYYLAGTSAASPVIGDFDGNGTLDIAVTDTSSNSVVVLSGKGDGTFYPGSAYGVGYGPGALATADLNSDGRSDFIAANNDNTLSVLLGQFYGNENSTTTLTSSANPSVSGQSITLVATVTPSTQYDTVTFMDGNSTLGSSALSGGIATLTISTLSAGLHQLTAVTGLTDALGSSFGSLTQQVNDCATVSSGGLTLTSAGGQLPLTVAAPASCSWTISSDSPWITLAPSVGTGNATVTVTIAGNTTGVDRSGNVLFDLQTVPVTERSSTQVYQDVSPADYYFDAVNLLSAKGITNGCSAGFYCPSQAVTRAEMAIFLVRSVIGVNSFTYSPTPYFADTPSSSFGFAYIQKLFELGLTNGCGNGDYCPNDSVTRNQMAVFLMRMRYGPATAYDYPEDPYFADVSFDSFGFAAIQRMKTDNITSGCMPTLYCPSEPVIRGDMAIFLMRGAFNQLLPAAEPVISAVSQQTITHGTGAVVTITGIGTHFVQGTTVVNPVAGLTFGAVTVTNATSLSVNVTAAPAAQADPAAIWVTTGTEEAVLPNAVTIQ